DPSPLVEAGGRLFANVAPMLRNRLGRRLLLTGLGVAEAQSAQIIRGLLDDPRLTPGASRWPGPAARRLLGILTRRTLPGASLRALRRPVAARRAALAAVERLLADDRHPDTPEQALAEVERLLDRAPQAVFRLMPLV